MLPILPKLPQLFWATLPIKLKQTTKIRLVSELGLKHLDKQENQYFAFQICPIAKFSRIKSPNLTSWDHLMVSLEKCKLETLDANQARWFSRGRTQISEAVEQLIPQLTWMFEILSQSCSSNLFPIKSLSGSWLKQKVQREKQNRIKWLIKHFVFLILPHLIPPTSSWLPQERNTRISRRNN